VHEREQGKEWPWNIDVVLEINSVHNFFFAGKKILVERKTFTHERAAKGEARGVAGCASVV
jgi:hypothetical protein